MLKILFSNFQKTFTNSLIRLMYFSLLTNYMNYVAFDEALALLLQLKKNKSNFFFIYIYNLHFLKQKVYSHQVLIYLNVPGIPLRKSLQNKQIVVEQWDV